MATPDLFVVCRNCGSEVSPYVTECPYCGTRLRKRAPKIERPGSAGERTRRGAAPSLGRLRTDEIPGIRGESRPYATGLLVMAAVAARLLVAGGALSFGRIAVIGPLGREWWRLLTAPLAYQNLGYLMVAAVAIALFGWLLERRHGPLVVLIVGLGAAAAGMALAAEVAGTTLAAGGNGMALGLLAAWAVPDALARRRGLEVDADWLGVAAIAAVLVLIPLAAVEADLVAGLGGAAVGLVCGFALARRRPVG